VRRTELIEDVSEANREAAVHPPPAETASILSKAASAKNKQA
jgi:hypothetical protein